ncbi:Protein FAR-RED IMPAIRED RESPONSE 1, partial [Bienertia sinuspersici]
VMDKGVVEVEVHAMVVELEDSSRILDLEAPVEDVLLLEERGKGGFCDEGELELMLMLLVMLEVETYYKAYARQQGLSVVRAAWSGYKAKHKTRCVTDSQNEEDSGVKTSKKCECPVQIYASVNTENENELVVQEMNYHVKKKLKLGHPVGLKVAQIHNMLARERNGLQEMAINERDIRNELYKEKKLKLKDGDAKAMLEYFEKMTEGNQIFFHTYLLDNFSQIQDILWVDAHSRAAYEEFNDVVCFDITYLTNQYELPFANFVEKFSQKRGKCKGYNEFKDEISNAIYVSLSVPEFESSWMAVRNKHGLEDNVWLVGNFFASYFVLFTF